MRRAFENPQDAWNHRTSAHVKAQPDASVPLLPRYRAPVPEMSARRCARRAQASRLSRTMRLGSSGSTASDVHPKVASINVR